MADAGTSSAGKSALVIPEEIQKKYPQLIGLIKGSESMNDDERQYWINILPIMTEDQIKNLYDILDNEKKQLAAIDAKYQKEMERLGQTEESKQTEEERRLKRTDRQSKEATHKEEEEKEAEDLLKKIEDAGKAA